VGGVEWLEMRREMVGVVMNRIYMIGGYEVGSSRMMDGWITGCRYVEGSNEIQETRSTFTLIEIPRYCPKAKNTFDCIATQTQNHNTHTSAVLSNKVLTFPSPFQKKSALSIFIDPP
jgi:hypothetical protein